MRLRVRYLAIWSIPQGAVTLAVVALALGAPVIWWMLIGLGGGLANAAVFFLIWRLGWLDRRYRW